MFVNGIFVKGVGESRGLCAFSPGTSFDFLRGASQIMGCCCDALRSALKMGVHGSSDLGNRSETRGFYSADLRTGREISTEPIVLTRAREPNDA